MREFKKNSIYKHFKGNLYLAIDTCFDSESGEEMVLYRQLYGSCNLYVRKIDDFLSEVDKKKYPHTKQKYRFQEVEIEKMRREI